MTHRMKSMVVVAMTILCASAYGAWSDQWAGAEYLPGRMIVQFAKSAGSIPSAATAKGVIEVGIPELDRLFEEFEVHAAHRLVPDGTLDRMRVVPDLYDTYVVGFRDEYPVLDVVDRFHANPYVVTAEPDLLRRTCRTPNDPMWQQQWDKRIVGADVVWDIDTGSGDVICAGIDTGVDYDHNDLRPILWVNPGEDVDGDGSTGDWDDYPGDTDDMDAVDNDGNGYVDDFLGWDFIRSIGNCAEGEDCDAFMDNDMYGINSHGSHVAGIMVADGDNGIGMCGFSWNGTLMALRAGYEDHTGQGYMPQSATLPAINYAVANGARVINMSYGGPNYSGIANTTMETAWANGAILFGASGNDASFAPDQYPANYDRVMAVNATDSDDRLASFSNYGTWTSLCAPGDHVLGTVNGDLYQPWPGTSMASPSAAGVAALVWSIFPNLTNQELRDLLEETAEDISAQNPSIPPSYLANGRVSAENAVAALYPQLEIVEIVVNDFTGGDGDGRLEADESAELTFLVHNDPQWAPAFDITGTVTTSSGNLQLSNIEFDLGTIGAGETVNNSSDPVAIEVVGSIYPAVWVTLTVELSAPTGYSVTREFDLRIGRGQVLVVDDEAATDYEELYLSGIEDLGLTPDLWSSALDGTVSASEMAEYSAVIWSCGNDETTSLTVDEQGVLAEYLDNAGRLIVVGQGIDEDIHSSGFYGDYLHASPDGFEMGHQSLAGIDGNEISDGLSLLLIGGNCAGNGTLSPSKVVPVNGGEAVFEYQTGGNGAVMYSGAYMVAYYAFALEAACGLAGTNDYVTVLDRTLDWMEVEDVPGSSAPVPVPTTTRLLGNYPNPFNPTTTISYRLATPGQVRLQVFDVLGRAVRTLADQPQPAGRHDVTFDGSGLSSGVYVVRLEATDGIHTSKMMLLK